ncbi:hypothetical protein BZA70DRAFT_272413 [Myxozyma melibiosi]|uniref:25S rRNA (Uridine(2843)-N(3))-methyltransferase n=1 Tax=Myxozyma melibiosi TaxID=54550 RepID=A0ABR1FDE3_9ASCO
MAPKRKAKPAQEPIKYASVTAQQALLTLLQRTFSAAFSDPATLSAAIQAVKAHLYARDYLAAFDSPDYLLAYVVRWSSSRALAYLHVFGDLCPQIPLLLSSAAKPKKRVLCVGGGAGGEVLALAALANDLGARGVDILAVDIADWEDVFTRLRDGIARQLGWLAEEDSKPPVDLNFLQFDILDVPCQILDGDQSQKISLESLSSSSSSPITATATAPDALPPSSSSAPPAPPAPPPTDKLDVSKFDLITVLFTANELFVESKPRTISFLRHLCDRCKPGTILLILESAGSYSHISIGSKTFPVQFLLDHTLVDPSPSPSSSSSSSSSAPSDRWEKLIEDDSVWFRLDEKQLRYPLQLENMRFFIRLYKKL